MLRKKWNARTVIRRALIICETLRKGETPRFAIQGDIPYIDNNGNAIEFWGDYADLSALETIAGNVEGDIAWNSATNTAWRYTGGVWSNTLSTEYPLSGIAKYLEAIETPEFSFTQSTLREILQDVGSYIHGEPRLLDGNLITYDLYGGNVVTEFSPEGYASMSISQDIERFATNLDSSADNFVNTLGNGIGAKTEPFAGGFKTVRTETIYSRIEDSNMLIATLNPIRSITKLEVGYIGSPYNTSDFYDITAFVYESADYQRMSSYDAIYPLSKAYALYYSIGSNNIYGLNFRNPQITELQPLQRYAVINILNIVTGQNQNMLDNYAQLAFRVTYEPIYSARVQQSKMNVGDYDKPSTIAYQQGQNLIESQYYGEHLKGAIAKMGNESKVVTYIKTGVPSVLPKIGDLWQDNEEDWYITAVAYELQPYNLKFTINLTKDFQKLSDYVGINSNKRMFEISERQSFDSHIVYTDYVVIGDRNKYSQYDDGIVQIENIVGVFNRRSEVKKPISFATLQGTQRDGSLLQEVALPVQTIVNGNSGVLVCKYKDNYSAGENATLVNGNYYQNGVPYSDYFGNLEYLNVNYFVEGPSPKTFDEQTEIGAKLPIYSSADLTPTIGTNNEPLWVKKSSTEIPTLNYQINVVSNLPNVFIGTAFVKSMDLINKVSTRFNVIKVIVSTKRVNKFTKFVDEPANYNEGFVSRASIDLPNETDRYIRVSYNIPDNNNYRSIAFVTENNELVFGENFGLLPTESIPTIGSSFSYTRDIFIKHDIYKDKIQGGNQ